MSLHSMMRQNADKFNQVLTQQLNADTLSWCLSSLTSRPRLYVHVKLKIGAYLKSHAAVRSNLQCWLETPHLSNRLLAEELREFFFPMEDFLHIYFDWKSSRTMIMQICSQQIRDVFYKALPCFLTIKKKIWICICNSTMNTLTKCSRL